MKNIALKASIAFIVTVVTVFGGFEANTKASASTSCNSRTITGVVDTGTPPARSRFEYATSYAAVVGGSSSKTPVRTWTTDGSFPVDEFITGLKGNTTYFYRLVVTNDFGTTYGEVEQFTTPACDHPAAVCEDPAATNYNGSLPCKYPAPKCQDHEATNYGGNLPCKYQQSTVSISMDKATYCVYRDGSQENDRPRYTVRGSSNLAGANIVWSSTKNGSSTGESNAFYGDSLNGSAMFSGYGDSAWDISDIGSWTKTAGITKNFGSILATSNTVSFKVKDCTPPAPKKCEDPEATNYGGSLPCKYPPQKCMDPDATNYGGSLPCRYPEAPKKCMDHDAINYGGSLPCRYKKPEVKKPTIVFTADDTNVDYKGKARLTWFVENADKCIGNGGSNQWAGLKDNEQGFFDTGELQESRTYTLTCSNSKASLTKSLTIQVGDREIKDPTVDIWADDESVSAGQLTTIHWEAANVTSCKTSGSNAQGWTSSSKDFAGLFTTTLAKTTIFNITCKNEINKSVSASVKVTVDGPGVDIRADNTSLLSGESTNVHWESTNAKSCRGEAGPNGWAGKRGKSGVFFAEKLKEDTTFNITCENVDGTSESASVTVFVQGKQPTIIFKLDKEKVPFGGKTTLRWKSEKADYCEGTAGTTNWIGSKELKGTDSTGILEEETVFTITCTNNFGSTDASVTVKVAGKINVTTL